MLNRLLGHGNDALCKAGCKENTVAVGIESARENRNRCAAGENSKRSCLLIFSVQLIEKESSLKSAVKKRKPWRRKSSLRTIFSLLFFGA